VCSRTGPVRALDDPVGRRAPQARPGHDDGRTVAAQLPDPARDLELGRRVDGRGGLDEHQARGLACQRACQDDTLPLPARQVAPAVVEPAVERAEVVDDVVGARRAQRAGRRLVVAADRLGQGSGEDPVVVVDDEDPARRVGARRGRAVRGDRREDDREPRTGAFGVHPRRTDDVDRARPLARHVEERGEATRRDPCADDRVAVAQQRTGVHDQPRRVPERRAQLAGRDRPGVREPRPEPRHDREVEDRDALLQRLDPAADARQVVGRPQELSRVRPVPVERTVLAAQAAQDTEPGHDVGRLVRGRGHRRAVVAPAVLQAGQQGPGDERRGEDADARRGTERGVDGPHERDAQDERDDVHDAVPHRRHQRGHGRGVTGHHVHGLARVDVAAGARVLGHAHRDQLRHVPLHDGLLDRHQAERRGVRGGVHEGDEEHRRRPAQELGAVAREEPVVDDALEEPRHGELGDGRHHEQHDHQHEGTRPAAEQGAHEPAGQHPAPPPPRAPGHGGADGAAPARRGVAGLPVLTVVVQRTDRRHLVSTRVSPSCRGRLTGQVVRSRARARPRLVP